MIKCKKHPKYQAKRKPRAECIDCDYIWFTKNAQESFKSVGNY